MLIKDYVDAHLGHALHLQELAGLVEMNVDSFLRAFKQSTGMPPHRYILNRRIERATALLRVQALPITEVAVRAGFGTQSSFARAFRRMKGTTPRGYRSNSL
jgi:AraC family transcriptional regulator